MRSLGKLTGCLIVACLVAAGCRTDAGQEPRGPSTAAPGGHSSSPVDPDRLKARTQARLDQDRRARGAVLDETALADLRLQVETPMGAGGDALSPCRPVLASNQKTIGGYVASWKRPDASLRLEQYVVAYGTDEPSPEATAALAEVRDSLTCKEHRTREGRLTLTGTTPLPEYPGVADRLAFCERIDDGPRTTCTVLLARGDLLSKVRVVAPTQSAATEALSQLAAAAARALVKP